MGEFLKRGTHDDFKKITTAIFEQGKVKYYKEILINLNKRISTTKNKSTTIDLLTIFKKLSLSKHSNSKVIKPTKIINLFIDEQDSILSLLASFETAITQEKNSNFKKLYLGEILCVIENLNKVCDKTEEQLNLIFKRLLHIYLNRLRDGAIKRNLH